MPKSCLSDVTPNFAKSTNSFINIAVIKASPGPVNTPPIPFTIPLAKVEPIPSPSNKSFSDPNTELKVLSISPAASANPISPNKAANSCALTFTLLIKASKV